MTEWIPIIALGVSIIAAIVTFIIGKQVINATNVTTAINAVPSLTAEVEKATYIVVNSIEQARRKNKLEYTPELATVTKRVRSWLPKWAKDAVSDEQIVEAINAAILLASLATNQINAAKATIKEAEQMGVSGLSVN